MLLVKLWENFTLSSINFNAGRYWTLITSAFSHNMLMHFAFNMISFNALAGILAIIPGIGAFHILALSLGSAAAGSAAWLYQSMNKPRAIGIETALGASGIVMGVGAAAACLMPFAPMQVCLI
jgi:membrane associated rhomboid family serine protease